ncbi:hypothetical protein ACR42D_19030 [Desulfovibrio caledoniensis]
MEIYSEASYMEDRTIRDVFYQQICRLRNLIGRMRRHRNEAAARRELSALSPWLKADLGIGEDGRPLDRKA